MKQAKSILVIGSGGREHAIAWKLAQSNNVKQIYALPGSIGIQSVDNSKVQNVTGLQLNNFPAISQWCKKNYIDLVIVGPEEPLANGLGDELVQNGILCFGPNKAGAQIEADKNWAKAFMIRHNIPTARYESFTDPESAKRYIKSVDYNALVVKASGLAAGKGVVVADNTNEACLAVDEILGSKKFGSAGDVVVIEEKLSGEEISVLAFVDSTTVRMMLPSQDHKRLKNNDIGPNTGGMGAYCPCPIISQEELNIVYRDVLIRAVEGLRNEQIQYCGVLYAGIMLTQNGPKVLEFNCRFGDPETQVILPLLQTDLYDIMEACCTNNLSSIKLSWRENISAVGVVMASRGYPETSTKGCVIKGIEDIIKKEDHIVFHSGISKNSNNELTTNGGRVLISVVLASDLETTAELATEACRQIMFEDAQYRTDIAAKGYKSMISYKSSGVDIDAGDALVQRIKPLAKGTNRPGVIGALGGFSGLFRLNDVTYKDKFNQIKHYEDPVLVQSTDGVGTKLKIALSMRVYDTIGIDLVAMCINDILCVGAEPLAFLDYIACGKLEVPVAAQIIKGIAEACRESHCALLGGETAEMPVLYKPGKYDLAGYGVGIVEYNDILPKVNDIQIGDVVIGLPSSGIHSNGFSLVNKIMELTNEKFSNLSPFSDTGSTFGREFLTPTKIYVTDLLHIIRLGNIKAIAHITGGGLLENIPRILPDNVMVQIDSTTWQIPKVFGWLAAKGNVPEEEMLRTFNCGIGMVIIISKTCAIDINMLKKVGGIEIGCVIERSDLNAEQVVVRDFGSALAKISKCYLNHKTVTLSYRDSGVNIDHGNDLVHKIKPYAISTSRSGVVGDLGGFAGLFRLKDDRQVFRDPILVMGADGVGTKLKIAQELRLNKTVGIDLVAMCVNDLLCVGAHPISFLDYFACGKLDVNVAADTIYGIAQGCIQSGSALLGGETAEMPGIYEPGDYDLAGFSLGIVEYGNILPRTSDIHDGDLIIGLPSSGVHSNGFSLIHKLCEKLNLSMSDVAPFSPTNKSIGEELLTPTKIYSTEVQILLATGLVKGIAHITGGGLIENIPRVLPEHAAALIDAKTFYIPPIFAWIATHSKLPSYEMLRTFNCGIGLILIVSNAAEYDILKYCHGFNASVIGTITKHNVKLPRIIVQNFDSSIGNIQRLLKRPNKRVGVLISGNGSNLQSLINATQDSSMGMFCNVSVVISNKADAYGLIRSKNHNIPSFIVSHSDYSTREDFDMELSKILEAHNIDIVCLAGFMRILSKEFIHKWKGNLINIHPSLLPKHRGLNAQRQALEAGDKISGCSVHFVDENVDTGTVIVQEYVPIYTEDTVQTLTDRIHEVEHTAYPKALRLLATDCVQLNSTNDIIWN